MVAELSDDRTVPFGSAGLPDVGADRERRAAECRRLMELCFEQGFHRPAQAALTARRALQAARALAAGEPGDASWVDLEALALGLVANAERVGCNLDAAHAAMARSVERASDGSGDPRLAARLLDLQAALAKDSGRLEDAVRLNEEAVAAHLRLGDRNALGRALVQKAVFLAHVDETARAVEVLQQAFEHLVPRQDRFAVLAATQCLAFCLHRMGFDIAAAGLVDQAAAVVQESGERYLALRLQWLKVRIQMNLGHDGERGLLELRKGFLELGMIYDAALACVDLATYYAKQRRLPDLQRLAREMFPIFTSRQIHREALASLLMLRETLSGGRAELPLLEDVRSFLERSRHDHSLRFSTAHRPH